MKKNIQSNTQVPKSHYFNLEYDTKARWISYWYQINEVVSQNPKSVLEIGSGNKTVYNYLMKIGLKVKTCDFDKTLEPDVVANVLKLPFKQNTFDVVICAEVLEHLQFKYFAKALKEIYRVTRKTAIISLPHFSLTNLYFGIKVIPFIPKNELSMKVDYPFNHKYDGEHYWEIGKKEYPLSRITGEIIKSGFSIQKMYYPKENPRHHFFVLNKLSVE